MQILAGLEADVLGRRNGDLLVRARIASFARLALADIETTETGNRAALAALTRIADVADESIERSRGLLLRDTGLLGDGVDDVALSCHKKLPPVLTAEKKKCSRFARQSR